MAEQYSIVNYRHTVVQQISRSYSSHVTETLYLLISNSLYGPAYNFWVFIKRICYQDVYEKV